MRILLVEDDSMLADATGRALTQTGHAVDLVNNGVDADAAVTASQYDLVLLDIGLPKLDGFEVLKRLRGRGSIVPVLILTAREAVEDRVTGLDLGADDYLTKPFHLAELEARVRALIRRSNSGATANIVHNRLRLDTAGRRLFADESPVDLSMRELSVLELMLLRGSRVVTKQQIIDHLYNWGDTSSGNAVEVLIYRLRKKLEPYEVDIKTIRGMGYLIERPSVP